jgi:hypothetical protein
MDTNEGMRKCGKNILNNRYEQQVQAAMDRHAKSKEFFIHISFLWKNYKMNYLQSYLMMLYVLQIEEDQGL